MDDKFRCICVCPVALGNAGLAIAAARAGGIGVLDFEFSERSPLDQELVKNLVDLTEGDVGVHLGRGGVDPLIHCLELLAQRPHWVLLSAESARENLPKLPPHETRTVLVELCDVEELGLIEGLAVDGIVAKGHEAGGWVGEDTGFILGQKLWAQTDLPFYMRGGVGFYTAAAWRAIGAAGVLLEEQLLLMPESALPRSWQQQLGKVTGQDTRVMGERLGQGCRVFARPGHAAIDRLQQLVDDCETGKTVRERWRDQATTWVGWRHRSEQASPIGQAIGFAAAFCARYQTTGRLVRAILEQSAEQIESACTLRPLISGAPLAVSHRTQYPIVQGPMTRVSDTAEFADLVAQGGSLPFLALALMTGEQTLGLLQRTKALLGERPWGVGLLGFVPKQLRDQQIAAVWRVKPGFALIAGGRPDQALQFEQQGIPAYLHVPSPTLLGMFLEQGARRFVFEGRECGGHVGPLTSLVLWESMIRVLLDNVPKGAESTVHVLFAGGISDAVSAAMVSVMGAPLAERGIKLGVLMGTAYLFTQEIVAGAATVQGFQEQALACQRTVNLETGPGHATRCAVTPFAREFYQERRRMLMQGRTGDEIRDRLEDLNLGRLRIASKGKARLEDGGLTDVDESTQYQEGMYMIGQVATLKQGVTTISELHRAVSVDSMEVLNQARIPRKRTPTKPAPSNIAIIGIGTLLPGAVSAEAYWHNILRKVNTITEIPRSRWDWRLYFDENRNKRTQEDRRNRDKIYSKWGGFLDEVPFDPLRFGIPPNSLKSIDPIQLLALEVVRRALEDAGYAEGHFDRENTSVILGAGGGLGDLGLQYGVRSEIPRFVGIPAAEVWARLPEWTEESFAGSLLNVIAGRIANRFNFGGLNLTVDAACASSLAAINLAVTELENGRSNVAIAGGVDTVQSPFGFLCFSMTQALSPRGRARTFDEHGDGIVISEGLAVVVLKRLQDAERDGDRIYALIKAVAGSSDGKALGLTAPLPAGQMRALHRAYSKAGFSPSTLGLIEAHGTGTPVGDRAETETVVTTLKEANTPSKSCVMGSVKTLMGHTKATAGAAGLIKVALALHHKVLPAHDGVESPIAPIADEQSPVYLLKEARPWLAHPDYPRRGALSSFGFGGTNFHAVLEEYDREYRPNAESPGAFDWPHELLVWRAPDEDSLVRSIRGVIEAFEKGAQPRLRDLAYSLALQSKEQDSAACALTVVAESTKQLVELLREYVKATGTGTRQPIPNIQQSKQIFSDSDQMAFLFPGQGSQYPNMVREPVLFIRELREAIEHADRNLGPAFEKLLSQYIYPPGPYGEAEERRNWASLTDTRVAQPAIGAVEAGLLEFTRRLGLKPAMTAGHSYGEYAALYAAGVISRDDFLLLSETRGRVMAQACSAGERGTMAAVMTTRVDVEAHLSRFTGVQIANHNASKQVVISGPEAQVEAALEALSAAGISGSLLSVAGAFHTAMVASAQEPLTQAITATSFAPPEIAVFSNTTGQAYPADPTGIRALLNQHMLRPVEFVQQIEGMYGAGVRVFVEVGPKSVLTGLVSQILKGRDHLAVALDGQGGGLGGLLNAVATLWVAGVDLDIARLFDGRRLQELDLNRLAQTARPVPIPSTAWYITGGGARAPSEGEVKTGSLPALTLEAVRADRQARDTQPKVQPDRPTSSEHAVPATRPVSQVPIVAGPEYQGPGPLTIDAFNAYQETMRRFLALQDQVMERVLAGGPVSYQPGLALNMPHSAVLEQPRPEENSQDTSPAPLSDAVGDDRRDEAAAAEPVPKTVPTPVSASLAAPSFDRGTLMPLLLEVVSERTGYPAEMLGVEQDLEAELGIDSIKRVEVLGALQKRLPEELAGRIRERMESFTRVKTLKGIVAELGAAPVGDLKAEPKEQGRGISSVPALDGEELMRVLLEVVSERTGYPAEMLGVEQDLEAELGIDSIKRVEVLGALQKRLSEELAGRIRERMESFTRVKTLKGIVAELGAAPVGDLKAEPKEQGRGISSVPALDGEELMRVLLEVVSERTGYPAEMLGVEQDLEAELGIDSIKRVEVLGALQKRLPEELAGRIRERMESFTRVKTLKGIVAELGAAPVGDLKAEPKEQGRGISSVPALDGEELMRVLLEVVSERTGYPAEMLGVEQDLEAELGIDSIKRVEVLGALQKRLSEELAGRIRERMESFTRVKTLKGIVAGLTEPGGGPGVSQTGKAEPVLELPRFTMQPSVEPLTPTERSGLSGLYLITRDTLGIAEQVVSELSSRGAEAVLIDWRVLAEGAELSAALAQVREGKTHLSGIVHVAALGSGGLAASIEEWREHNKRTVKCLFALLKHIGADLQATAERASVVAVSRSGGYFGRHGSATVHDPAAGATLGLLKTLVVEWPGVRARALDFDDSLSAAGVAQCIADEIGSRHNVVEIGYPGGVRTVFRTVQSPFQKSNGGGLQPRPDWVVLITAGARGITHQVVRELAQPGMKFIIVGRTPEPPPEPPETAAITEVAALRRLLVQAARDSGDLPTPAAIEREITELVCAREIRANLAYLCDVGIHVEYQPVDVRDAQAFGTLIDDIYRRYDRIDAVLHGAGIIDDKLIIDKTLASFEQVYDTKVDSTYTLSRRLRPESLELMVLFSSVAGRYGNRGQCDYAAANEVVNRLAWLLNAQWPKTRVMAINWGPWDTAGMASEGIKRQFRERGIVPISIPEGRRFFTDELRYGRKGDVEVVVGVGPWQMLDMIPRGRPPISEPSDPGSFTGLLRGRVPLVEPNGTVTFVHEFSSRSDPYLCDHRLDGKLVLPAAVAAEWIAQVVQAAWVDWRVTELRDLRVLKGFVLEHDTSKRALFRARPSSHSDTDGLSVSVEMLDPETKLVYYRGLAVLRSQLAEPPQVDFAAVTRGQRLEPAYTYEEYLFHGDRFRLLEDIQAVGTEGIDAVAVRSDPKRWFDGWQHVAYADAGSEFWIFDPGLLDTAPQLAIVWSRVMHGSTALPSCFGAVVRYANFQSNGPVKIAFRIHPKSDEHSLSYDAYFMGADGRVCLQLRDVESTSSPALNRLAASS